MTAKRYNDGKPQMSYILQYPSAIKAIARVMEYGACKYEVGNWKKGGKPDGEYLDSMMRHVSAWVGGELYDDESGCSHLAHAIWNLLTLHELNHPNQITDVDYKTKCDQWAGGTDEL